MEKLAGARLYIYRGVCVSPYPHPNTTLREVYNPAIIISVVITTAIVVWLNIITRDPSRKRQCLARPPISQKRETSHPSLSLRVHTEGGENHVDSQ